MRIAGAAVTLLFAFVNRTLADVIEVENQQEWIAATASYTIIAFQGFPDNTIITNQYASLGVLFTDGTDRIRYNQNTFLNDGVGLNGALDEINLAFSQPMHHIGADFPGVLAIDLYWQGNLIHSSDPMTQGFLGNFGGLISDEPFDAAVIYDPLGGVFIDDLYFGPPVPAPAGVLLFAAAAAVKGVRRRRYTPVTLPGRLAQAGGSILSETAVPSAALESSSPFSR